MSTPNSRYEDGHEKSENVPVKVIEPAATDTKYPTNDATDLTPAHREYLLERYGTLDLDPIPDFGDADPYNWPPWKKITNLSLVAFHGMMSTFTAASITPALMPIGLDLGVSLTRASYLLSIQIAVLGWAPLFWRPLSNRFGRRPIFLISLICSLVGNVGCAKSPSYATMGLCRAIVAWFISPAGSIGPAVVAECFFKKERGRYMGIWTLMVTLGVPVSSFVFGFVANDVGYRWIYWILAIINAIQFILYFFLGPETRYLRRGVQQTASTFKQQYLNFKRIEPTPLTWWDFFQPLTLITRACVFIPAAAYSMIFLLGNILISVEIPQLFGEKFHFNAQQLGLQYIGMIVGSLIGAELGGSLSDFWMNRRARKSTITPRAEFRLWISYPGYLLTICGVVVFLVRIEQAPPLQWNVTPIVGSAIAGVGNQIVTTVLVTYAVDCYREEAASVGVFITLVRQTWGFIGPFWFPPMFTNVGLLGSAGIAVALMVGVSVVPTMLLQWKGKDLRGEHLASQGRWINWSRAGKEILMKSEIVEVLHVEARFLRPLPSASAPNVVPAAASTVALMPSSLKRRSMTQLAKEAAKSWSSTLRLPKSTFPARAAPADLQKYLNRSTDDLYHWQKETRSANDPFVIQDGPPYANGDLHVGHALNKILKDIINRTQLQRGRRVHYIPGWDCHGLPIEQKALEHHGWSVENKPDAVQVRKAAASFANDAVQKQMSGFRSWAVMGEWDDHWKTMDRSFELRQLQVFRAMAGHGLIYRKNKPVYWSPSSRSALAEAELEYKDDHISKAALVKFPLNCTGRFCEGEQVSLLIWTTTPWTLPANQAIAINKTLDYVIVDSATHGKLLLTSSRVQAVEAMLKQELPIWKSAVVIDELLQSSYHGLDSFDDSQRSIIHADFVSADAGTGLVHCAPGHGMEDYEALQPQIRSGVVQIKAPVDDEGRFTAEASPTNPELLCGKSIFGQGNAAVIAILQEAGSLLALQDYKHKYPYDWRTKQPVLVRATAQWFTDLSNIKADALKALDAVDFRPETGQSRLRSFVESRSEWCISRQRSWGVPIPALYHKDTGDAILTGASVGHIIALIRKRGIDAWWSDPADDATWVEPGLPASQYLRGTDTMDVWFDSGTSWSMINSKFQSSNPQLEWNQVADVYLEGTDQHRGWFQSSLLTSVAVQKANHLKLTPKAPFKQLVTHGFTLDEAGKKMSKSVGNVISPDQIITGKFELPGKAISDSAIVVKGKARRTPMPSKKREHTAGSLGPDALRLWVASSDWSKDVVVSETAVRTVHASLHKYRVTFKLLLGALEGFNPSAVKVLHSEYAVDRLALLQLHQVCTEVRGAFENMDFHKAVAIINRWINADLSAFYVEAIKDTIYCGGANLEIRDVGTHKPPCYRKLGAFCRLYQGQSPTACSPNVGRAPAIWYDEYLKKTYSPLIMAINPACKIAQEQARTDKKMASSLECNIFVNLPGSSDADFLPDFSTKESRSTLESDLKEILVVSYVKVVDLGQFLVLRYLKLIRKLSIVADTPLLKTAQMKNLPWDLIRQWSYIEEFWMPDGRNKGFVMVYPPGDAKCPRCWQYTVVEEKKDAYDQGPGEQKNREGLCKRCGDVVSSL